MVMRRKPSAQQPRTIFRTTPLNSRRTSSCLNEYNLVWENFTAHIIIVGELSFRGLQKTRQMVYDSSTASLYYREQKTFSSNHLLGLKNVLKDNLVVWFEPE